MVNKVKNLLRPTVYLLVLLFLFSACSQRETMTSLDQLANKEFAVPTGTIADQLVQSKYPQAKFQYYNSVLDGCLAVKNGKADAAAYDEPILRNIAAKNAGLTVLSGMITVDNYGFAVRQGEEALKQAIDQVLATLKHDGTYDQMLKRWLPEKGAPEAMPQIPLIGNNGVLRFGTAAVTEPFSFVGPGQKLVGLDLELAHYIARQLGMQLKIVNMDFGGLIPALMSSKVDMIGACITISEERKKKVLFSEPYYVGGIAALVRQK